MYLITFGLQIAYFAFFICLLCCTTYIPPPFNVLRYFRGLLFTCLFESCSTVSCPDWQIDLWPFILSETAAFGINSILYQRGIYPPETFSRVTHYDMSLQLTTDPKLKNYLTNVVSQLKGSLRVLLLFTMKGFPKLFLFSFFCCLDKYSIEATEKQYKGHIIALSHPLLTVGSPTCYTWHEYMQIIGTVGEAGDFLIKWHLKIIKLRA